MKDKTGIIIQAVAAVIVGIGSIGISLYELLQSQSPSVFQYGLLLVVISHAVALMVGAVIVADFKRDILQVRQSLSEYGIEKKISDVSYDRHPIFNRKTGRVLYFIGIVGSVSLAFQEELTLSLIVILLPVVYFQSSTLLELGYIKESLDRSLDQAKTNKTE